MLGKTASSENVAFILRLHMYMYLCLPTFVDFVQNLYILYPESASYREPDHKTHQKFFKGISKSSDYALYTLLKSENSGKCNHARGLFPSPIHSCLFCLYIFLGHVPVKAVIAQ